MLDTNQSEHYSTPLRANNFVQSIDLEFLNIKRLDMNETIAIFWIEQKYLET